MRKLIAALLAISMAPAGWAQGVERMKSDTSPKTIIGPPNPALDDGAQALLLGDIERGIQLTHKGLEDATDERQKDAALSNLCAGYLIIDKFDEAISFCDLVLSRDDKNWRAYNNRALLYIKMEQFEKAEDDLIRAEALRPDAEALKVVRSIYMNAVHPVAPEVIIDDRRPGSDEGEER